MSTPHCHIPADHNMNLHPHENLRLYVISTFFLTCNYFLLSSYFLHQCARTQLQNVSVQFNHNDFPCIMEYRYSTMKQQFVTGSYPEAASSNAYYQNL